MGEKALAQLNNIISDIISTNSNTALVVRRIKDELIDMLDFQNKLEIAIFHILIWQVCFLKVKPKVNKKVRRNKARFHCLFAFR